MIFPPHQTIVEEFTLASPEAPASLVSEMLPPLVSETAMRSPSRSLLTGAAPAARGRHYPGHWPGQVIVHNPFKGRPCIAVDVSVAHLSTTKGLTCSAPPSRP